MATITYFAHRDIIRKAMIGFMDLFNDIYIEKYREGKPSQLYRVPIQFVNREKYFEDLQSVHTFRDHDGNQTKTKIEFDIILPRIGVNVVSMNYDPQRKLNKMNKLYDCPTPCDNGEGTAGSIYAPVPWNLEIEMSILTKTMDDGLQIIEQILPRFTPSKSINVRPIEGFASESIPIVLNSVTPTIEEEVPLEEDRLFTWLLIFTMKMNIYPPEKKVKQIKQIGMNIYIDESKTTKVICSSIGVLVAELKDVGTGYTYELVTDGTTITYTVPDDSPTLTDPMTGRPYRIFIVNRAEIVIGDPPPEAIADEPNPREEYYFADQGSPGDFWKLTIENGEMKLTKLNVTSIPREDIVEVYNAEDKVLYTLKVFDGILTPVPTS